MILPSSDLACPPAASRIIRKSVLASLTDVAVAVAALVVTIMSIASSDDTYLVSIVSTDHGRRRCQQRRIPRIVLQRAIKYGTREPSYGNCTLVKHDGFTHVFKFKYGMRMAITSYPSPLEEISLSKDYRDRHRETKGLIHTTALHVKSHTVLAVYVGRSMQNRGCLMFRNHQDTAYSTLATELIGRQVHSKRSKPTDLVSLIEFDDTSARAIFTREPCSWVLHNKLLARREVGKRFPSRRHFPHNEAVKSESSYVRAVRAVCSLLECSLEDCPIALIMITDSEPNCLSGSRRTLCEEISTLSAKYDQNLSLSTVGIGSEVSSFATLRAMVDVCNRTPGLARADFVFRRSTVQNQVDEDETSVSSSLTDDTVQQERDPISNNDVRHFASERKRELEGKWQYFAVSCHRMYDPSISALSRYSCAPPGAAGDEFVLKDMLLCQDCDPGYLALNTLTFGSGAERVAFRCSMASTKSKEYFALDPMIAKETRLTSRLAEGTQFHKKFCATQSLAAFLADEFNNLVRKQPFFNPFTTPIVTFIPCSVLELKDSSSPTGVRSFLVEKMLDTERFRWTKWSDESGKVIQETDNTAPSEYLHAFSHFTHVYTGRKLVVCELKGVYNTDSWPPTFELTSPVIHYRSLIGRKNVYGCTDEGKLGFKRFVEFHQCSRLCRVARSQVKNADWSRDWGCYHERVFGKRDSAKT